ncbi:endonuclease/exonuclease/phosphatase family protein [Thalassoroseus pseudoceratinae]|uniref:endonuclease/exonuclease/phosphatase family protein n=1 Tax=Thalassoroseus pseudoceratinae TaxID=2713176 RepID=UPI0036F23AA5
MLETESPPDASSSWNGLRFRRDSGFAQFLEWIANSAAVVCIVGLLLRVTFQDRIPRLAVVYYMTPLIMLAVGYLGVAVVYWFRRKRRRATWALVFAVLCSGWWLNSCVFLHASSDATPKMSALLWNTQRGAHSWLKIAEFIRAHDAPIIGLVEAAPIITNHHEFWNREFDDRTVVTFDHQMVVMTQGEVIATEQGVLHPGSFFGRVDLRLHSKTLTVFIVDIKSKAWGTHRANALNALKDRIASVTENPVMVLGDFNTPTDSAFFDTWRPSMRNAFEESGRGQSATWPRPLPVLSLDQIWLAGDIHSLTTRHLTSPYSDHQAVVTELTW